MRLSILSAEEDYEVRQHSRSRDAAARTVYCVDGCGSRYVVAAPTAGFDLGAPLLVRCVDCGRIVDPVHVAISNTLDPLTLRALLVALEPVGAAS